MKQSQWLQGNFKLLLGGAPVEMQFNIPAKPVKLRRMLPVFQQLTNKFVEISADAAEKSGTKVSCRKGCGACCRQSVPIAEVEAFKVARLIENLPEPRRSKIKQRFENASRHFRQNGWFEKLQNCPDDEELKKIALEYFYQGVPCPLLENESCSIHRERPLACREFLVSSPPENCADPSPETVDVIPQPVKPSNTLRRIGHIRKFGKINFMPLVFALDWVENNSEDFPEKTGDEWMADFFGDLTGKEIS